jgi:hypothetical protein
LGPILNKGSKRACVPTGARAIMTYFIVSYN